MIPESPLMTQSEPGLQRAGRLYALVLTLMLVYVGFLGVIDAPFARAVGPLLVTVFASVSLFLQRRQRFLASMTIFVWGIWCAATIQAFLRNGLANPAVFAYPALFLLGGWVIGVRQGMALGIASILSTLGLALTEKWGWLPGRLVVQPIEYWVPIAMVLTASIAAMRFILNNHWDDVRKTTVLNQQLEKTIALLSARENELQQSEKSFQVISQRSPLPISIWRLDDGRCLMVNPAYTREFGWSEQDALGKTSLEMGFWEHPDQRAQWLATLKRDGRVAQYPLVTRSVSGQFKTVLLSSEIIVFNDIPSVLSLSLDQTERLRVEDEIRTLNSQLETRVSERTRELSEALQILKQAQDELVQVEKLASLGSLVAGIAHELNTPIGNALTTVSALEFEARQFQGTLEQGQLKRSDLHSFVQKCRDGVTLAERSLHRAATLVQSFKQVAVDQASERRREFDLAEVVTEVIDTLRPTLKGKPASIHVDIQSGIRMTSYPGPLGQIVMNLVMNAWLHAFDEHRGGEVHLQATPASKDGFVMLTCKDNGRGIPAMHIQRIFDPFFTTQLGQGGSGLGLSIVHRLCTQVLRGQIQVTSTEGTGTSFTLMLPQEVAERAL